MILLPLFLALVIFIILVPVLAVVKWVVNMILLFGNLTPSLNTVEPVLCGTMLSSHPLLSGKLSKSLNYWYCNFELY